MTKIERDNAPPATNGSSFSMIIIDVTVQTLSICIYLQMAYPLGGLSNKKKDMKATTTLE